METFVGTICAFGFNYAPYGWQLCTGQLLPVQQYAALFALLGTAYGGNGTSTFGLPNLQGRAALGQGQGAGLPDYIMGDEGGSENIAVGVANLPPHTHQVSVAINANNASVSTSTPAGSYPGNDQIDPTGDTLYNTTSTGFMAGNPTVTLANAGANTGTVNVDSRRPYLAVNYSIAMQGTYPTRQ